jgi:putative acetyltransferase
VTSQAIVRPERPDDVTAIRALNDRAFRQPMEGKIVDGLRTNAGVLLSLVACDADAVIGHILFSPASIDDRLQGAALGPMAVHPDHQRRGVGARLIEAGLAELQASNCPFVIVLGHPDYYPRFGFERASAHGIRCEWEVPDEAFMVLPIDPVRLRTVTGLACYRHEFSTVI